jgi:DNA-binding NarL/FixJ family response regulator
LLENQHSADRPDISERTVKFHVSNLLATSGVRRARRFDLPASAPRSQLIAAAVAPKTALALAFPQE